MIFLTQQLPATIAIYLLAAAESVQKYPLIDQRGETIVEVGVVLLAVVLVTAVRVLNPKVEHAILLSIGFIAFFFIK